jgi:hypothetical protein
MSTTLEITPQGTYSISEVCEVTRLSRARVKRLIESGAIEARALAGPPRVLGRSVLALLGEGEDGHGPARTDTDGQRPDGLPVQVLACKSGLTLMEEVAIAGYAQRGELEAHLASRYQAQRRRGIRKPLMPNKRWLDGLREAYPQPGTA